LVKQILKVGGDTSRSMQCLLARAARSRFIDPTTTNARIVLRPQIQGMTRHDWWAHPLIAFGQKGGDMLVLTELEAGAPEQITTHLPRLSYDAHELLELLDVVFLVELYVTSLVQAPPEVVTWLTSHSTPAATEISIKASA
jgi:hypothetical protein